MVTVLTILDISPGHEAEWKLIWMRAQSIHEDRPGFRRSRLLHDTDNVNRYVILSDWDNRSDYDAFMRHMGTEWLKRSLHYLAQPATVMYLDQTEPEQVAAARQLDQSRHQ